MRLRPRRTAQSIDPSTSGPQCCPATAPPPSSRSHPRAAPLPTPSGSTTATSYDRDPLTRPAAHRSMARSSPGRGVRFTGLQRQRVPCGPQRRLWSSVLHPCPPPMNLLSPTVLPPATTVNPIPLTVGDCSPACVCVCVWERPHLLQEIVGILYTNMQIGRRRCAVR
ncbi:hypothetical protein VPH35_111231 [Triticum aestivum]